MGLNDVVSIQKQNYQQRKTWRQSMKIDDRHVEYRRRVSDFSVAIFDVTQLDVSAFE